MIHRAAFAIAVGVLTVVLPARAEAQVCLASLPLEGITRWHAGAQVGLQRNEAPDRAKTMALMGAVGYRKVFGRLFVGRASYSGADESVRWADIDVGIDLPAGGRNRASLCPHVIVRSDIGKTPGSRLSEARTIEPALSVGFSRSIGGVDSALSAGVSYVATTVTGPRGLQESESDKMRQRGAVVTLGFGVRPTARFGVTALTRLVVAGRTRRDITLLAVVGFDE